LSQRVRICKLRKVMLKVATPMYKKISSLMEVYQWMG
jgi:hypothetical protein